MNRFLLWGFASGVVHNTIDILDSYHVAPSTLLELIMGASLGFPKLINVHVSPQRQSRSGLRVSPPTCLMCSYYTINALVPPLAVYSTSLWALIVLFDAPRSGEYGRYLGRQAEAWELSPAHSNVSGVIRRRIPNGGGRESGTSGWYTMVGRRADERCFKCMVTWISFSNFSSIAIRMASLIKFQCFCV